MADVTEVIHKITYEVEDRALQNATQAIRAQLHELTTLNTTLVSIQKEIARTGEKEIEKIEQLSNRIEGVMKKMEAGAGKTKGVLDTVRKSLMDLGGAGDGVEGVMMNFIQPFIDGIPGLLKGATTIGTLATKVFSFSNIVTASISVVALWLDSMEDGTVAAEDMAEASKKAAEFSKSLGEESAEEMSALIKLKARVEDTTLAYNSRLAAANELQKLYPQVFSNLSKEEILAGKVGDAYQRAAKAIIASARARVFDKQLEAKTELLVAQQNSILAEAQRSGVKLVSSTDPTTGQPVYSISKADSDAIIKGTGTNVSPALSILIIQQQGVVREIGALVEQIKENAKNIPSSGGQDRRDNGGIRMQRRSISIAVPDDPDGETAPGAYGEEVETEASKALKKQRDAAKEKEKKEKKDAEDRERELAEERKQHINDSIGAYQTLADAAVKAINTIYDAQKALLDKEIELRTRRVEEAKELALRGNTEQLRIEEERLQKAQAERERLAQRQLQLNAIIQASNQAVALSEAIGAVVSAAAEGDPYTIAFRVAAAVAALVAGITALSGAFSKANAFADGVVDYKGKGGPRDDANWVRISSGESVITADGTKANRHILEAINSGAQFKLMNPALPYTMPMFRTPDGSGVYASAQDLGALEGKLDSVVNAIEDNRLRQNIYFNEHGVGIMTEKAMRRDRKRWM